MHSKKIYLQEEAEWIESSGEIPEVAFYEALFNLTEREDGPRLTLTPKDMSILEDAVMERYKMIILRDLDYTNRGSPIFRGLKRAVINYDRLKKYQARKNRVDSNLQATIGQSLLSYIDREYHHISKGRRYTTLNCTREKIEGFAEELGIDIPPEYLDLCFRQIPLTFDETYRATLLVERADYPFKYLHDRGDYFEIVIFNTDKQPFPIFLKIFCNDRGTQRQDAQLKTEAIYQSIPKSIAPWEMS
jgi:hypothetical protein